MAFQPKSRWDNKILQVQGKDRRNRFLTKRSQYKPSDDIIAIYHQVRSGTQVSRIQIAVIPQFSGPPLYLDLLTWLSSSSPLVAAWKVIKPSLGGKGPDSAVIYLLKPLSDPGVKVLVGLLKRRLGRYCRDINLFGLEKFDRGIYGSETPSEHIQIHTLKIPPRDTGSAGTIISALISKAAYYASKGAKGADKSKYSQWGKEKYVFGVLEMVLKKDVGWRLVP